jgi:hypothetical protein
MGSEWGIILSKVEAGVFRLKALSYRGHFIMFYYKRKFLLSVINDCSIIQFIILSVSQ